MILIDAPIPSDLPFMIATQQNIIDKLIDICWKRVRGTSDFIFLSQIRPIINEIQDILQKDSLFNERENEIIKQFIQSDPMKKLQKQELKKFIDRSVEFGNFEIFLLNRHKLTSYEIKRRIEQNSLLNDSMANTKIPRLLPNREYKYKVWDELRQKDDYIKEKTQALESKDLKYSLLLSQIDEQLLAVKTLKGENLTLKKHIQELESQLSRQPPVNKSNAVYHLQLKERDLTIKKLDQVGKEYKKRIHQLEQQQLETSKAMNKLKQSILEQDKLVGRLKERLINKTNDDTSKLKKFVTSLPIIKQWYILLKYKMDNKSTKMFALNIMLLILTAWLFGMVVQMTYRTGILLFSTSPSPATYVYDSYGKNRLNYRLGFDVWRNIPWLEKLIYHYLEW